MNTKLHLYYGTGKGKTTAAMGLALRSVGHGHRVLIAQFMKSGSSGELEALRGIDGAIVYASVPVHGFLFNMSEAEKAAVRAAQTEMTQNLINTICAEQPGMIILDELAVACQCGIVEEKAAATLIQTSLQYGETIVTGRDAPGWIKDSADCISRIDEERHPYSTEGLNAREGIEW